jgi:hypothetical protein
MAWPKQFDRNAFGLSEHFCSADASTALNISDAQIKAVWVRKFFITLVCHS